jgi:hypothetical protein
MSVGRQKSFITKTIEYQLLKEGRTSFFGKYISGLLNCAVYS